tara:strand:+ start:2668 stop:3507 length:840 start_codon:yes stop_codon:yes gene_type:complete
MFQINWKIKSLFYKILNFFKLYKPLYFIQKRVTKRSKVKIENIVFYWNFHLKYLRENKSKKIIEIGAGKSLAQNIYLSYVLDKKIEQTVIDVSKMIDLDLFNNANQQISKILNLKKFPEIKSISDLKENYNIIYLAPMSLKQIFDDNLRYDACISSTTLEHIPKDELIENFKMLKRIIDNDGIISATIDYSDHYSHTDKNISDLNYLKFNSKDWKKYNTPMLFQNRLRHQDYRKIFKSINFKIDEIKGDFGKSPGYISDEFDKNDKETFLLWGHFLLKH